MLVVVHPAARDGPSIRPGPKFDATRPLPLGCEWEEIPEAYKAHIYPTLELDMKAMKDNIKVDLIPFKTDQEILDEIVLSDNRQNMLDMGRKQQEQEKELHRKQAEVAQAQAYLASLKADTADQQANVAQQNSEANNAAQDLARENNNESSSGEEEEAEQHTGGDDDYSDEDE
ncbi:hypothetical protein Tco_1228061 [Tanacetum coccineum]